MVKTQAARHWYAPPPRRKADWLCSLAVFGYLSGPDFAIVNDVPLDFAIVKPVVVFVGARCEDFAVVSGFTAGCAVCGAFFLESAFLPVSDFFSIAIV